MPEAISADVTAELLLWYYEEPKRYRAEGRRRDAPLLESTVVLKLALGRRVDFANPALSDPGTVSTLRAAAGLYVRFLFFRPEATPYQILGLAPGATPEAIKESFRLLMHLVHPDRQDERVVWPESYAALANRAYGVLRNQDSRVQFDREAQSRAAMARARAVNRTAEEVRASRMPVPLRTLRRRKRGPLDGVVLPEWLTAGVGGFAREHPSATAFTTLIGAAVVAVAFMVWEQHDGALTRDADAAVDDAGAPPVARLAKLRWFSSAPNTSTADALASASAASAGVKHPPSADAKPSSANVKPGPTTALDVASTASPPMPAGAAIPARNDATAAHAVPSSGVAAEQSAPPPPMARASLADAGAPPALPAVATVESAMSAPRPAPAPEPAVPPSRQIAAIEPPSLVTPAAAPATQTVAAYSIVATSALNPAPSASAPMPARADTGAAAAAASPNAQGAPPATSEIESLFATFVESYERGRIDAFASLFDVDAEANLRQGRPAIRGEYDELFRLSQWRKMQLTRVNWKRIGDRAVAKGEVTVRIGWRDGREVEQRLALDMELVRRDGRVVIARLSQQPKP